MCGRPMRMKNDLLFGTHAAKLAWSIQPATTQSIRSFVSGQIGFTGQWGGKEKGKEREKTLNTRQMCGTALVTIVQLFKAKYCTVRIVVIVIHVYTIICKAKVGTFVKQV